MRPYEEKYINECYREMQEEHDACGIGLVVNIDGKKNTVPLMTHCPLSRSSNTEQERMLPVR